MDLLYQIVCLPAAISCKTNFYLFQLFYISHLICFALFMVLLILHCPDFWKWICAPLGIYCLELIAKNIKMYIQTQNSSVIKQGNVLPSRYSR